MKYDMIALKRKMLVKYPFFGSVVTNVDYKENQDITTVGTDGKTIYYNIEYLEGLSEEEQIFVFAHEVCHIAFNHILRSEGKDPKLWNIATDAVINQYLKRDGLKMAPGGVDIAEAVHCDAEQLYEKLLREKKHQQENSSDESLQRQDPNMQAQNSGGSGKDTADADKPKQDVGHDTHSMWEQAVKAHKEQQEQANKKESLFDKILGKVTRKKENEDKTELEKKQEELEKMGEQEAFKRNRDDKKKQLEELKEAISKQASQAGSATNSDTRPVNDIGTSKSVVDWRYILRELVSHDVDWSYKNATIEDGVVTPHLEEQLAPETEILLDTSGSISSILLKNFLRECKNVLRHTKLKVGCFDSKFYGFHDIRTEKDIENMELVGGGGTDFNAAVNAFSRQSANKIIFTDGVADMPDKRLDAIWIVFGREKIKPKGGKVIYITPEQLERLYSYGSETKGRSR